MIKYANAEYSGQIINDQPNGYGTMKYYSGESYVGHFSDGKFDGSGTLYLKNGDIKEGEFSNGVIVRGSYKYHNGDV